MDSIINIDSNIEDRSHISIADLKIKIDNKTQLSINESKNDQSSKIKNQEKDVSSDLINKNESRINIDINLNDNEEDEIDKAFADGEEKFIQNKSKLKLSSPNLNSNENYLEKNNSIIKSKGITQNFFSLKLNPIQSSISNYKNLSALSIDNKAEDKEMKENKEIIEKICNYVDICPNDLSSECKSYIKINFIYEMRLVDHKTKNGYKKSILLIADYSYYTHQINNNENEDSHDINHVNELFKEKKFKKNALLVPIENYKSVEFCFFTSESFINNCLKDTKLKFKKSKISDDKIIKYIKNSHPNVLLEDIFLTMINNLSELNKFVPNIKYIISIIKEFDFKAYIILLFFEEVCKNIETYQKYFVINDNEIIKISEANIKEWFTNKLQILQEFNYASTSVINDFMKYLNKYKVFRGISNINDMSLENLKDNDVKKLNNIKEEVENKLYDIYSNFNDVFISFEKQVKKVRYYDDFEKEKIEKMCENCIYTFKNKNMNSNYKFSKNFEKEENSNENDNSYNKYKIFDQLNSLCDKFNKDCIFEEKQISVLFTQLVLAIRNYLSSFSVKCCKNVHSELVFNLYYDFSKNNLICKKCYINKGYKNCFSFESFTRVINFETFFKISKLYNLKVDYNDTRIEPNVVSSDNENETKKEKILSEFMNKSKDKVKKCMKASIFDFIKVFHWDLIMSQISSVIISNKENFDSFINDLIVNFRDILSNITKNNKKDISTIVNDIDFFYIFIDSLVNKEFVKIEKDCLKYKNIDIAKTINADKNLSKDVYKKLFDEKDKKIDNKYLSSFYLLCTILEKKLSHFDLIYTPHLKVNINS